MSPAQRLGRPAPPAVPVETAPALKSRLESFARGRHIPNLDALRAISILWVFLHHIPALPFPWARAFQENGRHGVSFFFVISGFLICTLFLREERDTGQIGLLKFYGRRVLRLMPLYYIVLLFYVVLVLGVGAYSAENTALFIKKLPSYIFYYSNVVPNATQGPFFFAWSLAVEEQFYLAFGLAMRWLSRRAVLGLIGALLAVKITLGLVYGPALPDTAALRVALSHQEPILMGVFLAFIMNTRRGLAFIDRYIARPAVLAAIGAAMFILVGSSTILGRSSPPAELLYVLMTLFVGGTCLMPELSGAKGRAAAHIGKISYGMYLLHMLVINSTRKISDSPLFVLALGVPVTIALATVVYNCIESPILRLRDRLRPKGRVKAEPAGPCLQQPWVEIAPCRPSLQPLNADERRPQ